MIIIAPYAKRLLNGQRNPKDYPFWAEVVRALPGPIVQVGAAGEEPLVEDFRPDLSVQELRALIRECETWVGCDSFFQHLAWDEGKYGVVLWAVSDPNIYGHPENLNLLKDRSTLAPNQFMWWENTPHDPTKFVDPAAVVAAVRAMLETPEATHG